MDPRNSLQRRGLRQQSQTGFLETERADLTQTAGGVAGQVSDPRPVDAELVDSAGTDNSSVAEVELLRSRRSIGPQSRKTGSAVWVKDRRVRSEERRVGKECRSR